MHTHKKSHFRSPFFHWFTLVELIVVISVLAVLATISFSQVGNITKNARDASRTTSISNIKWSLEIFYAQKGRYPFPDNPITLTWAWNSKLYKGVITTAVLPWLNTDTKDPTTNAPYQYATLSNTHYQIGTNLEWTTSFNQTLTNQVLADSTNTNTIPYIKWNYNFDPSLPSLFPIGTASGIFSPSTCFILESSDSPNNFSSTASDCVAKKDINLTVGDDALISYWDMETKFSSGGTGYIQDMSGNGNHAWVYPYSGSPTVVGSGTEGIIGQGAFNYTGSFIKLNPQARRMNGKSGITVIGFIKNTTLGGGKRTIWKFHSNTGTQWGAAVGLEGSSNFVIGATSTYATTATKFLTGTLALDTSKWSMIAGVIDYAGKSMKFYLNGNLVGSTSFTFPTDQFVYQEGNEYMDNMLYGTGPWSSILDGYIDEVKVFGRVFSPEQISQYARLAGL